MKHYDVVIIGAGTSGLSARREVAKLTDNYIVVDDGILGTTCARVGCMPSKVLIQAANDFHRRTSLAEQGISGGDALEVDLEAVMAHVRKLRDRFVKSVMSGMEGWAPKLVRKRARFIDLNTLDIGDERVKADRIVIATGSSPIVPDSFAHVRHRLMDTNEFFERASFPSRLLVVGLGVIGLELGQALNRLGVDVIASAGTKEYGGLSDPDLQEYAHEKFAQEFPIHLDLVKALSEKNDELHVVLESGEELRADAALLSMGRRPNLSGLGLEELGVPLTRGIPAFSRTTFRVANTPWYLAGDGNAERPILHEAADQGRIAGFNAVRNASGTDDHCFQQRTPLAVTFCDPNIALVGRSFSQLSEANEDFVTGSVSFEGQGRAIVKLKEVGRLHVYAHKKTGRLLGAELMAPDGEHLAHLLSWAIATGLTVRQTLSLPFYHPVTEEGLRTALRDANRKVTTDTPALEVMRCEDPPVGVRA